MQLTVIMENDVASFEVASDMKLQDFLALCTAIPFNNLRLINNGHQIIPTDDLLKKELNELNIQNGDAIQILPISAASTSFLVEAPYRAEANEIFIKCANPKNLEFLRKEAPALAAAYDRNDPEAFYTAYRQFKAEKEREKRLMLDETCVEGQRLIVELIRRQTIDDMHELAMEHRQEDLVPVHMLYIRMQINNHPVIAFVDTGAQVSLLAESTAKRCGLNFVDSRVQAKASGIGGIQKMLGRIYQCQLQVGKYIFSCPFDVMSDKDCQGQSVILGLNVLLQHQCTIDLNLKRRVLRFIDGTETPFLNEVEYEREKEAIENCISHDFLCQMEILIGSVLGYVGYGPKMFGSPPMDCSDWCEQMEMFAEEFSKDGFSYRTLVQKIFKVRNANKIAQMEKAKKEPNKDSIALRAVDAQMQVKNEHTSNEQHLKIPKEEQKPESSPTNQKPKQEECKIQ